jgi:leucyl-tRNA synthetase
MYSYVDKNTTIRKDIAVELNTNLLKVLAPFTPHITEELWQDCGFSGSVHQQDWPVIDKGALVVDEIELPIQINGKVRDRIKVSVDVSKEELQDKVFTLPRVQEFTEGKTVVKFILVPKKIINIVVK